MKRIPFIAALAFAFVSFSLPANALQICNHDPVCQAKRDGTTVEQAKKLDKNSPTSSRSNQGLSYDSTHRGNCKMTGKC
jgi:hypothetical protein